MLARIQIIGVVVTKHMTYERCGPTRATKRYPYMKFGAMAVTKTYVCIPHCVHIPDAPPAPRGRPDTENDRFSKESQTRHPPGRDGRPRSGCQIESENHGLFSIRRPIWHSRWARRPEARTPGHVKSNGIANRKLHSTRMV